MDDCNNTQFGRIETIYDPRAADSTLPIRKAAAIAISNEQGQVLIVRRSNVVDEFKGAWSFPSTFVSDSEDVWKKLQDRLKEWLSLQVSDVQLIGKQMGIRPQWRLLMHLFLAKCINDPVIQTVKYDSFQWVNGTEFFSQFQLDGLGECAKAYLDYEKKLDHRPSDTSG